MKRKGRILCLVCAAALTTGQASAAEVLAGVQTETRKSQTERETETEDSGKEKGPVVAVDPGHQGSWVDMSAQEPVGPGAAETKAKATTGTQGVWSKVPEYDLNLQVSLVLKKELENRGYQVVMTREDNDTAISNAERAQLAEEKRAQISVRIHANGSDNPTVSGALAMAPSPDNPYIPELSRDSQTLAEDILNGYCEATGLASQGVMLTDDMTGFNWSTVPVMILEMGYMSNQQDDLYMTDSSHYEQMAEGIANGIDAYFADLDSQRGTETAQGFKELEEQLNTRLDPLEEAGESWAVAVMDLNSKASCYIRGDQVMQSASVIKLYIMAAVYERILYPEVSGYPAVSAGESYERELQSLLNDMITVSDNEAANELVRRLGDGDFSTGAEVVNNFCREHEFTGTHMGRPFLAQNPEDDNYTSAADCSRLLEEIYNGDLVSVDASYQMLTLLKGQTRTGKIPAGLPYDVETANKTGEMTAEYGLGTIENDVAMVFNGKKPYVLCVLSNDIADNEEARQTIVEISSEVYAYLNGGEKGEADGAE